MKLSYIINNFVRIRYKRAAINAISLAAVAIAFFILMKGLRSNDSNTIAGSLAVITAVISTWSSQKVIWKQEDDLEPDISVGFDLDSRSGVIQLLLNNKGGSNAYDVRLEWIKPLIGYQNKAVSIGLINTFLKGETYRIIAAPSVKTFENAKSANEELVFTGRVLYKLNRKDKRHKISSFEISLEPYRNKLRPYSDQQNYYIKSAQLPEKLKDIDNSIERLTTVLQELKDCLKRQ